MFMLPARDAPFLAGGTAALEGTALAGVGPVAAQNEPVFLCREAVGETLTGRTDVEILVSHVAEVLLAETPLGLGVRGHRLGQCHRDPGLVTRKDLLAVEVAAIGHG